MQTLKNRYEAQKLEEKTILKRELLLRENFDKQTAERAIQVIKQLNSIKWPDELHSLKGATQAAVAELKNVMAGQGRKTGMFDKIISLFKSGKDNPFLDVVAYSSALYNFFNIMAKFVDALNVNGDENLTVGQIVSDSNSDFDENTFKNIVKKGLEPAGAMAKVKTNWLKKYLKNGTDQVADEINNLSPQQLQDFSKHLMAAISGAKDVSDKVAQADSAASGMEQPVNKETQPPEHSEPTTPTGGTQNTQPNEINPGHQNAEAGQKLDLKAAENALDPILKKAGVKNVQGVIKALADSGYLKMPER